MNILNRIIIVLLLFGLLVVVSIVGVIPGEILNNSGDWLHYLGNYFTEPNFWQIGIRILITLGCDLILALLIFFEIRPKPKRFIRVQSASGGMVTINDASIVEQLQHELDPVPGVIEVHPLIKARGNKVQALIHVSVAAGSSVPAMANHLVSKVQTILADDLGLKVYKQPEVRIKVAPAPEGMVIAPIPVAPVPVASKPPAPPRLPPSKAVDGPSEVPPPLPDTQART